jgi:hypothetical protein
VISSSPAFANLPDLVRNVEVKVRHRELVAQKLGEHRTLPAERRQDLTAIAGQFRDLAKAGVQGSYSDDFFRAQPNRFRAELRTLLDKFAENMHRNGRLFIDVDDHSHDTPAGSLTLETLRERNIYASKPVEVPYAQLTRTIGDHLSASRGCEANGIIPWAVINEIFRFQTCRWSNLASQAAEECWTLVNMFVERALSFIAPSHIAKKIHEDIVDDRVERSKERLLDKVNEVLKPYTHRHIFIMNGEELLRRMAKAREDRGQALQADEPIEGSAALVLDYVKAQYDIALDTFLENFANLAIEYCLVDDLEKLLTPSLVSAMEDPQIAELTAEPEDVVLLRETNRQKLKNLKAVLRVCKTHVGRIGKWMRILSCFQTAY